MRWREIEGRHDCWVFCLLCTVQYGRCCLERNKKTHSCSIWVANFPYSWTISEGSIDHTPSTNQVMSLIWRSDGTSNGENAANSLDGSSIRSSHSNCSMRICLMVARFKLFQSICPSYLDSWGYISYCCLK